MSKPGDGTFNRDKSGRQPAYCPDGIRHGGGVNVILAHGWNVGTCFLMEREKHKGEAPMRARVPRRETGAEQPVVVKKVL